MQNLLKSPLNVKNIPIELLKPYKNNAKVHPEAQIQQIINSIKEFGFNNPILIDENNEIIAGHGRFEAAVAMNLTDIPSIKLSHLSEVQKRAYRLADNKISENGGWNEDLLKLEFSELEFLCEDLDLSLTGFNDIELDVLTNKATSQVDEKLNTIPFVSESEIISRQGDVWTIGKHRIICGNSLERKTFEKLFNKQKADMVLQDPPYNVKISGHVCGTGHITHKEFSFAAGEMESSEFEKFLKANFELCVQFSKSGSLHYNFMDWRHMREILNAGERAFDAFINMCVWVKSSGGMGSLYRSQHELCFIFKNGKSQHTNNVMLGKYGRYRTNIWQYAGVNSFGKHKNDIRFHPTVKPVEMLKDALLDVTTRGNIVLDSFLGSGSTLIAAQQAKRICYGIEYEPLYVDTTIRRYFEIFGEDAVLEKTGETYSELLKRKKEELNV